MNISFYYLASSVLFFSISYSMEKPDEVLRLRFFQYKQQKIRSKIETADSIESALEFFDEAHRNNWVADNLETTDWFISAVASRQFDNNIDYAKFVIAQKLDTPYSRELISKYIRTPEQFRSACKQLNRMIDNDDYETAEFLLLNAESPELANARLANARTFFSDTPNATFLFKCCERKEQSRFVELLLKAGANPNILISLESKGMSRTEASSLAPLHTASLSGFLQSVESLLAHDADPNITVVSGSSEIWPLRTPLMFAAEVYGSDLQNYLEITKLLLDYGANRNGIDGMEQTALQIALDSSDARDDEGKRTTRQKLIEILQTYLIKEKLV